MQYDKNSYDCVVLYCFLGEKKPINSNSMVLINLSHRRYTIFYEMKYLLFNWNCENVNVNDPSELTDIEFQELAEQEGGFVVDSSEDFEARFNSEHFSTATHQLRIINIDNDKICGELNELRKEYDKIVDEWEKTNEIFSLTDLTELIKKITLLENKI